MQDDGREYIERLEDIRNNLGNVLGQRDALWALIREKALVEMAQEQSV
jgi:hypothetical protein